jgi:hypothetical protein
VFQNRAIILYGELVPNVCAPQYILYLPSPQPVSDDTLGEYKRVRELSSDEQQAATAEEKQLAHKAFTKVIELGSDFGAACRVLQETKTQTSRPATVEEATRLLAVAHQLAPKTGRMACYEWSLAAVLMAAEQGLSIDWVCGVSLDPPRLHAWPETQGTPIQTAADDPVDGVYTRWLRN